MKKLEWIIEQYYLDSEIILLNINILFLLCIIVGMLLIEENKRYIINKLVHNIFYIITIIGIGEMLSLLNMTVKIDYVYFNVLIFLILICFVMVYRIYQGIMFKKIKIPLMRCCKNIKYIIFFEVFLLAVTNHLELDEGVAGVLAVVCIGTVIECLKEVKESKSKKNAKESDYPNSDLYYARQKQRDKFISVLNQQKSEPYAIMVSSEWGMGKSSFIMALEEALSEDIFIWINSGSEKSATEIMTEISEKIVEVLKKNNILIEKEGLVEKYFLAFSGLLDKTNLSMFNKITAVFKADESEDSKEYLNSRLKELEKINKTIYLIIDDLDRCSKEYQLKMFKVIRESTQLVQCKTIFLVDKKEFLGGEYKQNNLEKYVNYTLDLCKVEYREIVGYLIDDLFDSTFIQGMNSVLRKERDAEAIRRILYYFPEEILQKLEKVISDMENDKRKKSDEEKQREAEKIRDIQQTIEEIKKNIINSRKVKNFLKAIKRDIENLNVGIEMCSQEYQKEDWLRAVIEVQFFKNILPDIYTTVQLQESILDLGKNSKSDIIEIILGLKYVLPNLDEKKITTLNQIIYKIDVINFAQIKLQREKYLEELKSANATINHIQKYIEYAQTYDEYSEILEICTNQKFESIADREEFIKAMLHVMSQQSTALRVENQRFYDLSKQMVRCLKQLEVTEIEKQICMNEGRMITRRVIVDNTHFLKYILMILHGVGNVEENWQTLSVTDINEFYLMLRRIDKESVTRGLKLEIDKLLCIKEYYRGLTTELQKKKYIEIGMDFKAVSEELEAIFNTCELWLSIESVLGNDKKEEIAGFNKYFTQDGVYYFKDNAFSNVSDLKEALVVLKKFYESKAENYESYFSLMVLRISYRIVLVYEADPDWFGNEAEEISLLLTQITNMIFELDRAEDIQAKNIIDELKIFVYKFNAYYRERKGGEESQSIDEELDEQIEMDENSLIASRKMGSCN